MEHIHPFQRPRKLKDIADRFGAVLHTEESILSAPKQIRSFFVPDDGRKADAILGQLRIEASQSQPQPKGFKRVFSSNSKQTTYSYQELYAALSRVVEENGPPGTAEALLRKFKSLDGDINIARRASTGMSARVRNSTVPAEPGRLLQTSTENLRPDFVQILAPHANQKGLDESLQIALNHRELSIVKLLLQYGANSAPHESVFAQAAGQGDADLIDLLLRAPKRVSDQCVSRSLLLAASNDHLQVSLLLVRAGADGNHENAAALRCAVDAGRADIVTALLLGKRPPLPSSTNKMLDSIFKGSSAVINSSRDLIEVLLCGGPTGNSVNEGLFKVTMLARLDLIHLLLSHGADINYDRAVAVGHAIQNNHVDLVGVLLQNQALKPDIASQLVGRIPEQIPFAERAAILSKLLVNGASGTQCSQLLITASQQNDIDTVRLLVSSKSHTGHRICSVEHNAALSLKIAVTQNNLSLVKVLAVEGDPSKSSLAKALESIPSSISPNDHFQLSEILLQAGADGPEVNSALYSAVVDKQRSNRQIKLLVEKGARVSDDTLFSAVSQGAPDIVEILLTGKLSTQACSSAIPIALKIKAPRARYLIIKQLLGPATASNSENIWVTQSLIETLKNHPEDTHLLRLICQEGKADINIDGGLAVILATKIANPQVLEIILQSEGGSPSEATVEGGLSCAIDLPLLDIHRRQKVEILLRGVKPQSAMNESLIKELKALSSLKDRSIVKVLLDAGADVNTNGGEPVLVAVSDPIDMDLILSKRPSVQSLSAALPQAINLADPARCNVCEKLLRAGAKGDEINKALCIAANEGPSALPLLKLLLPSADVNYQDGKALGIVVKQGFFEALNLLLTPQTIPLTIISKTNAFQRAMELQDTQSRFRIVDRLLKEALPVRTLSDALVIAVNTSDLQLCKIILQAGASVEYNGGQVVLSASSLGMGGVLKILVDGSHGRKPSAKILESALRSAMTLKSKDAESYFLIVKILLEAGARGVAVNVALLEAVKDGDRNLKLSEILFNKGASSEWNEGETLEIAVQSASIQTVTLLLQRQPSQVGLERAYRSVSSLPRDHRFTIIELLLNAGKTVDRQVARSLTDATWESPPDRALIKLLLERGAFDEGEAMVHAASVLDIETLGLLVAFPKAETFISLSFKDVMETDHLWQSRKGLEVVELMLKYGAAGDPVSEALSLAVEKFQDEIGGQTLTGEFLDVLLGFGADVNYQRGVALQKATLRTDIHLIQKLISGATIDSKAMSIPNLFITNSDAETVINALKIFDASIEDCEKDFFSDFRHPDASLEHVVFWALDKFPRKVEILRALLDMGYKPNQWKLRKRDYEVGMEPWPVLCWALEQPEKRISSINIELLIDEGANINFISKSLATPLLLAISAQRPDLVTKLISKGAKVSTLGKDGITPLALASSLGNPIIMQSLLGAGAERNDGSLHDAARELRCDAMRVLIDFGHQPDYPSERHDGRSALAEFCYKAADSNPNPTQLEETIQCLIGNGSDFRLRCMSENKTERSIFHFALDSSDPILILTALLKLTWQFINEDVFLFQDTQFTYSLTKYVEKNIHRSPGDQKDAILRLLRNKRALDKFFATDVESTQPEDICGAPTYILDEAMHQKIRKKRIEEQREDVLLQIDLKRLTVIKEVEILDIQNEAEIRRSRERASSELQFLTQHANTKLQLENHAENERLNNLSTRHFKDLNHHKALADIQTQTSTRVTEEERTRQMLQIEYLEMSNRKANEGLRAKLAIEGSARAEKEGMDRRMHEREMSRIQLQRCLVDSSTALAGRLVGSGMNQRQIGFVTGEIS